MRRFLFLAHRYMGIFCSLILLLWTLSGIVMMYKPYPRLTPQQTAGWLPSIDLTACCRVSGAEMADGRFTDLYLEMQGEHPILRVLTLSGQTHIYDLAVNRWLSHYSAETARQILGDSAFPLVATDNAQLGYQQVDYDQWTVPGTYNRHRPLHKFTFPDQQGTQLYLSSRTGEIVQYTTSDSRLWGVLGAVIHWTYPTLLRKHLDAWSQVVIWLSVIGTLLTLSGLYVGLKRLRRYRNGRLSPYRGWFWLHHMSGLIFGLLMLTWVVSGLLSMRPAGLFRGDSGVAEKVNLRGGDIAWQQVPELLAALGRSPLPEESVRLHWYLNGAEVNLLLTQSDGSRRRLDPATLQPNRLTTDVMAGLAKQMLADGSIASQQLLQQEDAYYYQHKKARELPVYRVIDGAGSHYYLSVLSGRLLQKIDQERQWFRWLFNGLHSGDFTPLFRQRPFWDSFMLVLLTGVSLLAASGSLIGYRYLVAQRRRRRQLS